MKIRLNTGEIALVDKEDYQKVSKFRWTRKRNHCGRLTYAVAYIKIATRKYKRIIMHRLVLGLTNPQICVDHINHDGLDNRRANLRTCTQKQNSHNSRKQPGCKSKYKGVTKTETKSRPWRARIVFNDVRIHLGKFKTEKAAGEAYDAKAIELRGEFAKLNFERKAA